MSGKRISLEGFRLQQRIELVRNQLNGIVQRGAAIDSNEVQDLSKRLDILIARYMRQATHEPTGDDSLFTD